MKRFLLTLAATASAIAMAPAANAAILAPGSTGTAFTTFDPTTQGTLLASLSQAGITATYNATLRTAVYRNTGGTLDFYYQVTVNTMNPNDALVNLSAFDFSGYVVDAMVSGAAGGDPDGGGIFIAPNNPNPGGFTSTASRNAAGGTIRADFNANTLVAGETSATYIFRTSAVNFTTGNFTVQDGFVAQVPGFAPIGPSVPEPATWAMMMLGFGAMGGMLRTRRRTARIRFA